MFARRKFSAAKSLLEFMGLEPGRVHFSWCSSAEAERFATLAKKVVGEVAALGPADYMAKAPLDKVAQ